MYHAPNASAPVWTLIAIINPSGAGGQTLTAGFTLPAGGTSTQVMRARFRYNGSTNPCGTGAYDDTDDLVFAVP